MGLFKRLKKFFAGKRRNSGELRGKRYEKGVARRLKRRGVNVVAQGKRYDYRGKEKDVEIDIETPRTAIEVKSGKNTGIEKRLKKYKEVLPYKEPIAYTPNIRKQYYTSLKHKNLSVFKKFSSLTDYLYNKGEFTKKGAKRYQKLLNRRRN